MPRLAARPNPASSPWRGWNSWPKKGEALTWSDFEGYAYEEAGSGLYIRVYDVNEECYVMVGGPSLEESPLYVRLVSRDDGEQYVELREGGLEGFLQGE